jgi:F-type H+-transporting ATPase subunit b
MLNLDLATIAFQVVNFLVLAVVLNRLLFQPLLRSAEARRSEKEQLLQQLSDERKMVAALSAEQERSQEQIEEQMQQATKETRAQAEAERQELLREAQTEAENIIVEAQTDAQRISQQAMGEFHEQIVDSVLGVSAAVIGRVAPSEVHDSLVSGLSERIRSMGRSEMQRVESIRRSLGEREPTAFITSARELTVEQQGQLAQILTALADRRVNFDLEVEADLVAGVRVRLGDTVMDNSITGRLQELKDMVSDALKQQVANA